MLLIQSLITPNHPGMNAFIQFIIVLFSNKIFLSFDLQKLGL